MVARAEVALMRLVAQRVVGPRLRGPAEVVEWLTAMQGQDLPGLLESVALRTEGSDVASVRKAFDSGAIVRTWPMRGTLHAVAARDAAWLVELLAERPLRAMARRRRDLGLTDAHVDLARSTLVEALAGGGALARGALLDRWTEVGLDVTGGRGYHLLALLAHERLTCLGPMLDKDQAFVLLDEWVPEQRRLGRDLDREAALTELALRYLRSHGPASEADLARWAGLPLRDVRAGIAGAGDALAHIEVEGTTYHLDPATPDLLAEHRDAARRVLLLPGFDEIVLGYADRTATIPPEHAALVVPGGNGMFRPTVLEDGVAVGTWRWAGTGHARGRTGEPFTSFSAAATARLAASG